jgi:hypothetical protein
MGIVFLVSLGDYRYLQVGNPLYKVKTRYSLLMPAISV